MNNTVENVVSKVPEATLGFWLIKIAATTLGETGGDWVTMSLDLGYLVGSLIFIVIFVGAVSAQVSVKTFRPFLYWAVIIATTCLGTTVADFFDRTLSIGYYGGVIIVSLFLLASLLIWHWRAGSIAIDTVTSPRIEKYYWTTILFSQTLGTALGDYTADDDLHGLGLGYEYSALIFLGGLFVIAVLYFRTKFSNVILFWAAFVLTRPLGATLGDFLDKPRSMGGLDLSRFYASIVLLVFIAACIFILPDKAGSHPGERRAEV